MKLRHRINPRTYKEWGEGVGCHPTKIFVSFLEEDKTSAPDFFQ